MTRTPLAVTFRIGCWLLAAALFAWALQEPHFRDANRGLAGSVVWPIGVSFALALAGVAVTTRWRTSGLLLALALAGEAAALQVIDAGPRMHYQHFRSLDWMVENATGPLAVLLVQTLVVIALVARSWSRIRAGASRFVTPWQLVTLGAAFVLLGATVSREVFFYVQELGIAAWIRSVSLATVLFAVLSVPDENVPPVIRAPRLARLAGSGDEMRMDRVMLLAALWVTALSATLSVVSYQRHPHIVDEVAYVYHARYLATGAITMPLPPVLDAFHLDLLDYDASRWYASPPFGWPAILAIGVALGVPWLVNPILAGLCVLLTYVLLRDIYDARTARIGALLLAVSPWHVMVGMSFMTHSSSLAFALLAACGIVKSRSTGGVWWPFGAGLATGIVGMIRPLEGMIVACLLGLWILGLGGKRLPFRSMASWAIGCLIIGIAIGAYNRALTGDPTTFPIMEWTDRFMGVNSNSLGFGPDRGAGWALDPYPGHGLRDAAVNANLNATSMNYELFGWGAGSLLLLVYRLLVRPWRTGDKLMLAVVVAVFVAHIFYYFSGGPDFAARYWYLMLTPVVALTASAVNLLLPSSADARPDSGGWRTLSVVAAMVFLSLVTFIPWRAVDKYRHYLRMRPDVRELRKDLSPQRSLVLLRGRHSPDFASAAIYNPIDLLNANEPVVAWDAGAALRAELLPRYADRPVWIVEGPSLTGSGYRIVEGPLTVSSILERDRLSAARNQWNPPYAERLPDSFQPGYSLTRGSVR